MLMWQMGQRTFEIVLTFGLFGFGLLVLLVLSVTWQRSRKLKVLQEALRSGVVDAETKQELLASTFGARSQRVPWIYRIGWFGMFLSASMLFCDAPRWWQWEVGISWWMTAVFAFAISLGAVTMPFAVRELNARRRFQPVGRSEP